MTAHCFFITCPANSIGAPKLLSQVGPSRIPRLNQSDFLRPSPALQLFLPPYGLVNVIKTPVVNKPIAMMLAGKSVDLATLVL
jgi:hypothetical protein